METQRWPYAKNNLKGTRKASKFCDRKENPFSSLPFAVVFGGWFSVDIDYSNSFREVYQQHRNGRRHLSDLYFSVIFWLKLLQIIVFMCTPAFMRQRVCMWFFPQKRYNQIIRNIYHKPNIVE